MKHLISYSIILTITVYYVVYSHRKVPLEYQEQHRTYTQIRQEGAILNLNETLEIITHHLKTRLIAWPGNGFQTQSLHLLIVNPGEISEFYRYQTSEEALLCLRGKGEVFLHNQWITLYPGDIAYFPENVTHAIRNNFDQDFVIISQITPPVIELYEPAGFYNRALCVMNFDVIQEAKNNIQPGNLSTQGEVQYNETYPELRAWNMKIEEIRTQGALFNIFRGAEFTNINVPMRLVLWQGHGTHSAGFHGGYQPPNNVSLLHTHPISDEVLMLMRGSPGKYFCGDCWVESEVNDCLLAPCGVTHGAAGPDFDITCTSTCTEMFCAGGGFASPPQVDLYLRAGCYDKGNFVELPSIRLDLPE